MKTKEEDFDVIDKADDELITQSDTGWHAGDPTDQPDQSPEYDEGGEGV